jgi:predicted component of type VI protein secretion system
VARLLQESGGERRETRIAGVLTIGRSPSVQISIDDKTLSREHTQVYAREGRYWVRDLGSKNGTFVNGRRIQQPTELGHGDRIRVGPSLTFTIAWDADDAPASTAATRPATATAPTAVAAPRPRRASLADSLPGPIAQFFHLIVFVGVLVVGTWFSKQLFVSVILPMIPK